MFTWLYVYTTYNYIYYIYITYICICSYFSYFQFYYSLIYFKRLNLRMKIFR